MNGIAWRSHEQEAMLQDNDGTKTVISGILLPY